MKEASAIGSSPLESWSELIEKTMSGYPVTQVIASAAQDGKEDPWIALIDRLWETNPYNNLLPMDPGEILNTFQKVWLDAFRNPTRLWTLYNEFVQNYTQLTRKPAHRCDGKEWIHPLYTRTL
jgi:hypothetical protein